MNLELGPRLEFRQELKQEQRLVLEQKLEQKLEHQLQLQITLEQYLQQEDLITGFIRWIDSNHSWVSFNKEGFEFKYGLLPYSIAKPIADKTGPGFAHCLYNSFECLLYGRKVTLAKGDWVLFVVKDMVPEELRDFVAIHERGEELSLANHYFASKLEFALANKKDKIRKYTKYIDEEHPTKFVDLTQKVMFPILPEKLLDYLEKLDKRNKQELTKAEELIEKYPIQGIVLRLRDKYESITQNIYKLITKNIGIAQKEIYALFNKAQGATINEAADLVDKILLNTLTSISPNEVRVVSKPRVNEILAFLSELVNKDIFRITKRNLEIPTNFENVYQLAVEGKRLVTPIYTIEDINKQRNLNNGLVGGYKLVAAN